ncbi:MAG: bifunctional (p)ppGpp synthetase/guanosine-3',5'-bis(diphosphate) 3'-pyrophosphohydrolase [Deltaproteobacteria bacterium]|nr:bifunctional (p)ppGpp synthetase/guanosine-3',5'-bis(diphosphate) 3'-pyrophosphohydrolase [Deltaproteobacteria bacterium]
MYSIDDVVRNIKTYMPDADTDIIIRAHDYAARAHEGQKRLSGVPFIQHPIAVADLAATLKLDVSSICASLLHDVREDSPDRTEDLEEHFGEEIALIVDGVTKLEKYKFTSKKERQAENFKKMLVAMSRDIRVLLVKLCDRLNNMRELEYHTPQKQQKISRETLEIYAPLAERLGISWIRSELEDLSFRFQWPEEYRTLKKRAEARLKERSDFIRDVIDSITSIIEEEGITGFEVTGRPKNLLGIFRKMQVQEIDLDHVYDFVAFRVIVQEVVDCWQVLGLIHDRWTPIPARFKDFINVPKPNGYRSLHTTVFSGSGEPMEVQIRTWEMHRVAESGIAAHWKYKEGGGVLLKDQEKFNWLKQLIGWAQEVSNPHQFIETVHESLFTDEIFVFTPKGELRVLPKGATPLDFAYEIHTEVGHTCTGARVNQRLVPLSTRLRSGDMIEIITSKHGRPKRDWLSFVVTARAQNKIRNFFHAEERAHAMEIGRQILDKEFKRKGLNIKKVFNGGDDQKRILERFRLSSPEEIYRDVGLSKVKHEDIIAFLLPEEKAEEPVVQREPSRLREFFKRRPKGIAVDGVEDMLLHLARCCNPIPGDEIVAFVTRGRGVTIHSRKCPSLRGTDEARLLGAHWTKGMEGLFDVPVFCRCLDEPGVLARVTREIGDRKANIASIMTKPLGDHLVEVRMVLQVEDQSRLDSIIRSLGRVKGVIKVDRMRQSE